MGTAEREARKKSLEENFAIEAHKDAQKLELLRMTKKNSTDWHWRGGMSLQRGKIIKKIMDRRLAREEKVGLVADELDARRQAGSIDIPA
jgi:large subunit ribosomal protein L23